MYLLNIIIYDSLGLIYILIVRKYKGFNDFFLIFP